MPGPLKESISVDDSSKARNEKENDSEKEENGLNYCAL